MKILNIILSIYIIMLTAYPCADKHNDVLVKSSQSQTNSQHNHSHDEETDLCSPFCICNCCGQQILNFSQEIAPQFRKIATEITTQIPAYKSILTSNFYGSIWKPPQIA